LYIENWLLIFEKRTQNQQNCDDWRIENISSYLLNGEALNYYFAVLAHRQLARNKKIFNRTF
jgi:hypothetical protein